MQVVAEAIRKTISPVDVANYEIAKYYVGAMINMANEMNMMVGYLISRATLSPDFSLSNSECILRGEKKKLSDLNFGIKLDMLNKIAKDVGVEQKTEERLSTLRNLPAHAAIVMTEEHRALLLDIV